MRTFIMLSLTTPTVRLVWGERRECDTVSVVGMPTKRFGVRYASRRSSSSEARVEEALDHSGGPIGDVVTTGFRRADLKPRIGLLTDTGAGRLRHASKLGAPRNGQHPS